jgi:serine/threonine protein kinase
MGINDSSVLSDIEKAEIENPSARKELHNRCIYVSRGMPITSGVLAISDFGAARIGTNHSGDVMPAVYRAPEIIMNMPWDCKIDTWALGVMVCVAYLESLILHTHILTVGRYGICSKVADYSEQLRTT